MRDGLYEMVRDLAAGDHDAEMRVEVARAMLMEAAEFVLNPTARPLIQRSDYPYQRCQIQTESHGLNPNQFAETHLP